MSEDRPKQNKTSHRTNLKSKNKMKINQIIGLIILLNLTSCQSMCLKSEVKLQKQLTPFHSLNARQPKIQQELNDNKNRDFQSWVVTKQPMTITKLKSINFDNEKDLKPKFTPFFSKNWSLKSSESKNLMQNFGTPKSTTTNSFKNTWDASFQSQKSVKNDKLKPVISYKKNFMTNTHPQNANIFTGTTSVNTHSLKPSKSFQRYNGELSSNNRNFNTNLNRGLQNQFVTQLSKPSTDQANEPSILQLNSIKINDTIPKDQLEKFNEQVIQMNNEARIPRNSSLSEILNRERDTYSYSPKKEAQYTSTNRNTSQRSKFNTWNQKQVQQSRKRPIADSLGSSTNVKSPVYFHAVLPHPVSKLETTFEPYGHLISKPTQKSVYFSPQDQLKESTPKSEISPDLLSEFTSFIESHLLQDQLEAPNKDNLSIIAKDSNRTTNVGFNFKEKVNVHFLNNNETFPNNTQNTQTLSVRSKSSNKFINENAHKSLNDGDKINKNLIINIKSSTKFTKKEIHNQNNTFPQGIDENSSSTDIIPEDEENQDDLYEYSYDEDEYYDYEDGHDYDYDNENKTVDKAWEEFLVQLEDYPDESSNLKDHFNTTVSNNSNIDIKNLNHSYDPAIEELNNTLTTHSGDLIKNAYDFGTIKEEDVMVSTEPVQETPSIIKATDKLSISVKINFLDKENQTAHQKPKPTSSNANHESQIEKTLLVDEDINLPLDEADQANISITDEIDALEKESNVTSDESHKVDTEYDEFYDVHEFHNRAKKEIAKNSNFSDSLGSKIIEIKNSNMSNVEKVRAISEITKSKILSDLYITENKKNILDATKLNSNESVIPKNEEISTSHDENLEKDSYTKNSSITDEKSASLEALDKNIENLSRRREKFLERIKLLRLSVQNNITFDETDEEVLTNSTKNSIDKEVSHNYNDSFQYPNNNQNNSDVSSSNVEFSIVDSARNEFNHGFHDQNLIDRPLRLNEDELVSNRDNQSELEIKKDSDGIKLNVFITSRNRGHITKEIPAIRIANDKKLKMFFENHPKSSLNRNDSSKAKPPTIIDTSPDFIPRGYKDKTNKKTVGLHKQFHHSKAALNNLFNELGGPNMMPHHSVINILSQIETQNSTENHITEHQSDTTENAELKDEYSISDLRFQERTPDPYLIRGPRSYRINGVRKLMKRETHDRQEKTPNTTTVIPIETQTKDYKNIKVINMISYNETSEPMKANETMKGEKPDSKDKVVNNLANKQKAKFVRPPIETDRPPSTTASITTPSEKPTTSAPTTKATVANATINPTLEVNQIDDDYINIGRHINISTLESIPDVTKTLKYLLLEKTGINARKNQKLDLTNSTLTTKDVPNDVVRERIRLLRLLKEHKNSKAVEIKNNELSYLQVSLPVTLSQILNGEVKVEKSKKLETQQVKKESNLEEKKKALVNFLLGDKSASKTELIAKIYKHCLSNSYKSQADNDNQTILQYLCTQFQQQKKSEELFPASSNDQIVNPKQSRNVYKQDMLADAYPYEKNSRSSPILRNLQSSVKIVNHGEPPRYSIREHDNHEFGIPSSPAFIENSPAFTIPIKSYERESNQDLHSTIGKFNHFRNTPTPHSFFERDEERYIDRQKSYNDDSFQLEPLFKDNRRENIHRTRSRDITDDRTPLRNAKQDIRNNFQARDHRNDEYFLEEEARRNQHSANVNTPFSSDEDSKSDLPRRPVLYHQRSGDRKFKHLIDTNRERSYREKEVGFSKEPTIRDDYDYFTSNRDEKRFNSKEEPRRLNLDHRSLRRTEQVKELETSDILRDLRKNERFSITLRPSLKSNEDFHILSVRDELPIALLIDPRLKSDRNAPKTDEFRSHRDSSDRSRPNYRLRALSNDQNDDLRLRKHKAEEFVPRRINENRNLEEKDDNNGGRVFQPDTNSKKVKLPLINENVLKRLFNKYKTRSNIRNALLRFQNDKGKQSLSTEQIDQIMLRINDGSSSSQNVRIENSSDDSDRAVQYQDPIPSNTHKNSRRKENNRKTPNSSEKEIIKTNSRSRNSQRRRNRNKNDNHKKNKRLSANEHSQRETSIVDKRLKDQEFPSSSVEGFVPSDDLFHGNNERQKIAFLNPEFVNDFIPEKSITRGREKIQLLPINLSIEDPRDSKHAGGFGQQLNDNTSIDLRESTSFGSSPSYKDYSDIYEANKQLESTPISWQKKIFEKFTEKPTRPIHSSNLRNFGSKTLSPTQSSFFQVKNIPADASKQFSTIFTSRAKSQDNQRLPYQVSAIKLSNYKQTNRPISNVEGTRNQQRTSPNFYFSN